MSKLTGISAKIPEEVYGELVLRVPEGERSGFIRDAILEKLQKVPRSDIIFELERRIEKLETDISEIKRYLVDLEVLTYERGEINPHAFGMDELDQKIIDHLIHYKGATTSELAEQLGINRWLILKRLKKIRSASEKQLGKPIVEYYAGIRSGKRKAWWIGKELAES